VADVVSDTSVAGMVDLLKQFDSDGKMLLNQPALAAAPATKLNVPTLGDAFTHGVLASGINK